MVSKQLKAGQRILSSKGKIRLRKPKRGRSNELCVQKKLISNDVKNQGRAPVQARIEASGIQNQV